MKCFPFEVELNPQGKKKAVSAAGRRVASTDGAGADAARNAHTGPPPSAANEWQRGKGIRCIGNAGARDSGGIPPLQPADAIGCLSGIVGATAAYTCDGRTHCSQMTSCEEATFFLKNCPGTQMDGNRDGVPCEQQWCK
jgi:hypothetical protein